MKIISAVGARPNFVKLMPLYNELKKYGEIKHLIVHSGQHYDYEMSEIFFREFNLPKPKYYLNAGSGSYAERTGKIIISFEKILLQEKPDLIIVYGDVNSTLAFSLAAKTLPIPLAHVEAGLRSFDAAMPEEINRKLTDHISDFLFVTEPCGVKNLLKEGIVKNKIFLVGDLMHDTLVKNKNRISNSKILSTLNLKGKKYAVLTLHRQSNVDDQKTLKYFCDIFYEIQKKITVIFPVHPRTKKELIKLKDKKFKNLQFIKPLGYIDFIALLSGASFVLTDSGGVQSEATFLNVPCLTLRKNTEKISTVSNGTNVVCGKNRKKIIKNINKILNTQRKENAISQQHNKFPAQRIAKVLKDKFRF